MSGYVELDRRFYEVSDRSSHTETPEESYLRTQLGDDQSVDWSKVLQHRLVVILGEPGSGKSTELRFQADKLRTQTGHAFYVRLDRLVDDSWASVLGPPDHASFEKWKRNRRFAWFLFDSVDESKLKRSEDFFVALDRISKAIGVPALRRASLVFSSRISEWRPVTDKEEIERLFSLPGLPNRTRDDQKLVAYSSEDGEGGSAKSEQQTHKTRKTSVVVFQLAPLVSKQIQSYVQARGLLNVDAFMQALDAQYAWEFARRPVDVNGLIEYWQQYHRLGTLTQLIENSVALALREMEPRETSYPLTAEKARQGAEALAAAALLCRKLSFKVPDDAHAAPTALDAADCLPTSWSAAEKRALLNCALFDGETYGCIRFHHRRIAEYLAASWLTERMRDGCPEDRLDGLLFARSQGVDILLPSLAPVSAWLANGTDPHSANVRERILATEPSVFFRCGDPAELPVEYKRRVLLALARRYENRQRVWLDHDPQALARLADPALAADVSALILNRAVAASLRADLLLLVRHGRLISCLEAALQVIADPAMEEDVKEHAVATIRDCGDARIRTRLATSTRILPTLTSRLSSLLCETLYPQVIDANGLIELLRKSRQPRYHDVALSWALKRHLQATLNASLAAPLLQGLMELIGTDPRRDYSAEEEPISQTFGWLCDVLPVALIALLEQVQLGHEVASLAARSIRILNTYSVYAGGRNDKKEAQALCEAVCRHRTLKQEYLWLSVVRFRASSGRDPEWLGQVMSFQSWVALDSSDISWLMMDARGRQAAADCALALRFAFDLWRPYKLQWHTWCRLWWLHHARPELRGLFWRLTYQSMILPARIFWIHNVRQRLLERHWWKRHGYRLQRARNWLRDQYVLHCHLYDVYSGRKPGWLMGLSREADDERHSSTWAVSDWSRLRRRRGPLIAWATRHGCEVSWTRNTPLLTHEKANPNETAGGVIVGLCGLQSLWQAGAIDFVTLTHQDAERATRYALCELNGFADWLPELAIAQPQVVRRVFRECVAAEWIHPFERDPVGGTLSKLVWSGQRYWSLIAEDLLAQLRMKDPRHPGVLEDVIAILLKSTGQPRAALVALAAERLTTYPLDSPFFIFWMALWLQFEALAALTLLGTCIDNLEDAQADALVLRLCDALRGDRPYRGFGVEAPDYLRPEAMRVLVPLVYRHIRPTEDIAHVGSGAYSPTARDDAQDFRDGLLQRFIQLDDPSVPIVLRELYGESELTSHRDWIIHLLEEHLRRRVDLSLWQANDIRTFAADYEADPRNDTDLFRIACWRMQDIKREVEQAENSRRDEVGRDWDERSLRQWLQRLLSERSRGRYSIPQEAEIDLQQRMDLRFENPKIRSAVPVEIKWAEKWTAAKLLERLENQLVGQYLRAHNIRYGIYVLAYIGNQQHWDHPTEQRRVDFDELVHLIQEGALELETSRADVAGLSVVSINFTAP